MLLVDPIWNLPSLSFDVVFQHHTGYTRTGTTSQLAGFYFQITVCNHSMCIGCGKLSYIIIEGVPREKARRHLPPLPQRSYAPARYACALPPAQDLDQRIFDPLGSSCASCSNAEAMPTICLRINSGFL